jgi:hypothetical protein
MNDEQRKFIERIITLMRLFGQGRMADKLMCYAEMAATDENLDEIKRLREDAQ